MFKTFYYQEVLYLSICRNKWEGGGGGRAYSGLLLEGSKMKKKQPVFRGERGKLPFFVEKSPIEKKNFFLGEICLPGRVAAPSASPEYALEGGIIQSF